jgi:hypothetical protein
MVPVRGVLAYSVALGLGIVFSVWLLSWHDIVPPDVLHAASIGDEAVSVVGQRYFLADPWHWPLLLVPQLAWPGGTNVALADSIPLALLLLKPVRWLLAPGASVTEAWFAVVLALQPVAAVFALREAGERRALPALAVAVLAMTMPSFLNRSGHMALCSHAAILCAIGLYFVLVPGGPKAARAWWAAIALLAGSLLIHPYILAMVAAVLAAVPLTRMLRRMPGWWSAGLCWLGGLVVCACLAWLLGYGGSRPAPGFGSYAMNLLNPVLPQGSSLFPDVTFANAGGEGWEGYQYLGAGILGLAGLAVVQVVRGSLPGCRRHGGLVLVLVGLTVFALSNIAYAGPLRLYHWRPVPAAIEQFRSTGRFFWPVAYVILVAGVAGAARSLPTWRAASVLIAAMALQWADTTGLRATVRHLSDERRIWHIDAAALRPIFAAHTELALWPVFGCGATPDNDADVQVMLLASETLMRTNTMNTARDYGDAACNPAPVLAPPLRQGELRMVQTRGDAWFVPGAATACRELSPFILCSANPAALIGTAPLAVGLLPLGKTVANPAPAFQAVLSQGWAVPEGAGVWSEGSLATLRFHPAGPGNTLTLAIESLAPQPGGAQTVQAVVGGDVQGDWVIQDHAIQTHTLSLSACAPDVCAVQLRIGQPVRPKDRADHGTNEDPRPLGIYLRSLRLDAQ